MCLESEKELRPIVQAEPSIASTKPMLVDHTSHLIGTAVLDWADSSLELPVVELAFVVR